MLVATVVLLRRGVESRNTAIVPDLMERSPEG